MIDLPNPATLPDLAASVTPAAQVTPGLPAPPVDTDVHQQNRQGALIVSAAVLVIFAISLILLFFVNPPVWSQSLILTLIGGLAGLVALVGNYWLGSSSGSAAKTQELGINARTTLPVDFVQSLFSKTGGK